MLNPGCPKVVVALGMFVGSGTVLAQFQAIGLDRRVEARAKYQNFEGVTDEIVHQSSISGPTFWTSAVEADLGFTASAQAGQTSGIYSTLGQSSTSRIFGSGSVNALASRPTVNDSREASALSVFSVDFTVDAATPIVFDGSIPTAAWNRWSTGPLVPVHVVFTNLTTGDTLAEIRAGLFDGPTFKIESPVHLETTLLPGTYRVFAKAEQAGTGDRSLGDWSGLGSFDVNLLAVPAPGVLSLATLAIGLGAGRRRR